MILKINNFENNKFDNENMRVLVNRQIIIQILITQFTYDTIFIIF